MGTMRRLRSITDARIGVISSARRDAAYAALVASVSGRPMLRTVSAVDADIGRVGSHDLALGLYARLMGPAEELVGFVAVSEWAAEPPFATSGAKGPVLPMPERLFVIEALTLAPHMQRWRPPVGALLAATAAMLIATVAHDPGYHTYVACRAPASDLLAQEAIAAIGGRLLNPSKEGPAPVLPLSGKAVDSLYFLDVAAAALSASIVLDHLAGTEPSHEMSAGGPEIDCEAMLSIAYPRALFGLIEELACIRAGGVILDWRAPTIVGNDVWLPRSRSAHAARF